MASITDKKEIFEKMPVPKAIAAMAVPTIISQLINLIYNLADTIFIGQTGDSIKIASITVVFTIFMMTISFSNLFGIGGGSLIARLIGAGREEDAKKVCSFSVYGALVTALLYSLLIGVFLDPVLRLLGASDRSIGYAREYTVLVVIIGNVPVILSMTVAHLLRNAGYSKQASIGLSGGGVLNLVLDPLFMFVILPQGREVFGAALATLLSNVASCVYLLLTLRRVSKAAPLSLRFRDALKTGKTEIKNLFAVGIPSAILTALFDVANIFLNSIMSYFHGDLALAATGIVMKAERLPNAINIGLCQGMLPIVAYNYSSGNRERMQKVIKTVRIYGLLISAICIVLFEIFAAPISRIFLNTANGNAEDAKTTLAFATLFLQIRCVAAIPQFLNYHTSFCMQAVGDGRDTLLHAVTREFVFYIPFMFLLNALFGRNGLICALIAGESCGAIFALILFARWKKKNDLRNVSSGV